MLVQYYTTEGLFLLARPQDAIPPVGDHVPMQEADGTTTAYRVHHCAWPLRRPAGGHWYYNIRDAAECLVQVWLEEQG